LSITLPHELVVVGDILGFSWPEIDEDQMREAGVHLRAYADHASQAAAAHGQQITDLGEHYEGRSYSALAGAWSNQSKGNMETLIQGCHLLAGGMDLAAEAVVGMKTKVIVQLSLALAEFAAIQAAAVATLGLAEAALPVMIVARNRILNGILNECVAEVVARLVVEILEPVSEQVEDAVRKLMHGEIVEHAAASNTLKADPVALRDHAARMTGRAEESQRAGWNLCSKLDGLQFLTAG
jgi:uncharacterized protein YukE